MKSEKRYYIPPLSPNPRSVAHPAEEEIRIFLYYEYYYRTKCMPWPLGSVLLNRQYVQSNGTSLVCSLLLHLHQVRSVYNLSGINSMIWRARLIISQLNTRAAHAHTKYRTTYCTLITDYLPHNK